MTVRTERSATTIEELFRELPSVNEVLLAEPVQQLLRSHERHRVVRACRAVLEEIRQEIADGMLTRESLGEQIAALPSAVEKELCKRPVYSLRPVINATGVLLHTNLGRAPLSHKALEHVVEVASGYSNLEFDVERGERGKRDVHFESLILGLLEQTIGVEALRETHRAIVVNNCAAATFLALHALAKGKEVIVSRGELVEIGGGFRIPEILGESGAVLREVGTTNRTSAADYEQAITPNTGMILRVHQSNFSMDGFVARPALEEVVALGKRASIPVFEDQGTGLIQPLEPYGITGEPMLVNSVKAGCDLAAASGDKLFGGPQCGILIGTRHLVHAIRKDPLFRTYRVDKLSYAALEATLRQYLSGAIDEVPVLRMIEMSAEWIRGRCGDVARGLSNPELLAEIVETESMLGGGTAPRARMKSFALSLKHAAMNTEALLRVLRRLDLPVIGRIEDDRVLLDLRTVEPSRDRYLVEVLSRLTRLDSDAERGRL